MPSVAPPLLHMRDIRKSYPGVQALRGIDLQLHAGEVLGLVGENGAGKSTLIKILGGAVTSDVGSIYVEGQSVNWRSPSDSNAAGIAVIYQEFNLIEALTARENIFLGREQTTFGLLHHTAEREQAASLFRRLGAAVPLDVSVRNLSVAQQQLVEIAKALVLNARVLVMDEPTAALTPSEVNALLSIVGELRAQGLGIIYVSHRLEEIFALADRVMVLRDGQHVKTCPTQELTRGQLIEQMVGRTLDAEFPTRNVSIGEVRLSVRNLSSGTRVRDVSFDVRRGEVLGLTGLVGSGRTETARLIFAADRADSGSIQLDGRTLSLRTPRDAIAAGICLLTEDRKQQGLVLGRSVLENFGLPNLDRFAHWGVIDPSRERAACRRYVEQLAIKVPHLEQRVQFLSGGNQQKVVLAKWLESQSEVFLFDEPTRGIDVGAKVEIYRLINDLAAAGKAIVLISSELPEVLGMADRIVVMHDGRIRGTLDDARQATQEQIMELAVS